LSFQNVKIEGVSVNPLHYFETKAERGNPALPMSSGSLKTFSHCPSRWRAGYNPPDSDAKEFGRLLDCIILTPEQFKDRYSIQPATYKSDDGDKPWNNNSKSCRAWNAEQIASGKEIVKESELSQCRAALKRMKEDDKIVAFSEASDKQVWMSGQWKDEKSGITIPIKCLIDYVPRKDSEFAKCLGDLKTTRNAQLMPWQRWCFQAGYHVQAAFNTDMYVAASGEDRNTFCFILQENYEPWETAKRILSQDFLTLGRSAYRTMLENYCQCIKHDRWPSYDDHDEAIQGWSLVSPEPFMADREAFAPKYEFEESEPETEEQETDDVPV